jgi:hypothetical protein
MFYFKYPIVVTLARDFLRNEPWCVSWSSLTRRVAWPGCSAGVHVAGYRGATPAGLPLARMSR